MPYLSPEETPGQVVIDLADLRREQGPAPWRVGVVGTPNVRFAMLAWEPGFGTVPHQHPHADETFIVVSGRAAFRFGDAPGLGEVFEAGAGCVLRSPHGQWHDIWVVGDDEACLLIAVTPNQDVPDETIEPPGWPATPG
jgi:mannose-6-phosphate isomerase-like protein (cupin superfamily)